MKKILATMMALVLTIAAQAQRDTIGVSKFTAIYRYECKTTYADGQPVTDSMYIAVQTSGGITKSFPYEEYERQKKGGSRIADGYLAAQMHMGTIFTNYPEGRITTQEMLYPYRYMTDEPMEKQNWKLTDAQDSICGYAPDPMTTFGYVENSFSSSGDNIRSVAGVVLISNPHQYQPLEME